MSDRIGAVAVALITGNRVGMQAGDVTALRGSGLAHLLAISGLHLGLVMGVLYVFNRGFCCLVYPQFFYRIPHKTNCQCNKFGRGIIILYYCRFSHPPRLEHF